MVIWHIDHAFSSDVRKAYKDGLMVDSDLKLVVFPDDVFIFIILLFCRTLMTSNSHYADSNLIQVLFDLKKLYAHTQFIY